MAAQFHVSPCRGGPAPEQASGTRIGPGPLAQDRGRCDPGLAWPLRAARQTDPGPSRRRERKPDGRHPRP